MTDYGTFDKITYGNMVYKLKEKCVFMTPQIKSKIDNNSNIIRHLDS